MLGRKKDPDNGGWVSVWGSKMRCASAFQTGVGAYTGVGPSKVKKKGAEISFPPERSENKETG